MKNALVFCLVVLFMQVMVAQTEFDINKVPVSKADLGTFPYFKSFPNFRRNDSITLEMNRTYFFDGKKYLTIDGKVSSQIRNVDDSDKPYVSEFQLIQEFDKMVATLGGVKVYSGSLPTVQLKTDAGTDDIVLLQSKHNLASSAHYGVVEYVIKTADKEVWVQLQPFSMGSRFYTLLVVEKKSTLLATNTNKKNMILEELEKKTNTNVPVSFEPDSEILLTESKDEILSIVGVFQKNPTGKLKINVHCAPIGKPEYALALTQKRAAAIQKELVGLGVKAASIDVKGMGDVKPLVPNDTEKNRLVNSRLEIVKF
jgi:outer membrane protein OmpA-like peptidoglycan-associated protein